MTSIKKIVSWLTSSDGAPVVIRDATAFVVALTALLKATGVL